MGFRCHAASIALLFFLALAPDVLAHPAPFSYLDIHLSPSGIAGTLVLHDFDVAHDLGVAEADSLMDSRMLGQSAAALRVLLAARFALAADGQDVAWEVTGMRPLPE